MVLVYAPDGNKATYWTTLHNRLAKKPKPKQILIGDFNVTLDPVLDRSNYITDNHTKGREVINSWLQRDECTLMPSDTSILKPDATPGDGMATGDQAEILREE